METYSHYFVLATPLLIYQNFPLPLFPGVIILTNTLILTTLFFMFTQLPLLFVDYQQILKSLFSKDSLIDFANTIISIIAFSWIFQKLLFNLMAEITIVSYLLSYIVYKIAQTLLKKIEFIWYLSVGVGLISRFLYSSGVSFPLIIQIIIFSTIFKIISTILNYCLKEGSTTLIKSKDIKPHMVGFDSIDKKNRTEIRVTHENINQIQAYLKKKKIKEIMIKVPLPLAPYMFVATMVTWLIKGEVVTYLWSFFT